MTDDDLRDRLRRADPAASLPPLSPEQTRRLVSTTTHDVAAAPSVWRRRLPALVGAAALVVVAIGAVTFAGGGGSERASGPVGTLPATTSRPAPTTDTSSVRPTTSAAATTTSHPSRTSRSTTTPPPATASSAPSQPTVTTLTDSEADPGDRCPQPDASYLAATAQLALEGTVLRVEGNLVTLRVGHIWVGPATDLVQVRTTSALLAGATPAPGQTYLIAAADGGVMVCGYSGLADTDLKSLYERAFPGR